ncbi:hypothetical protein EJ04DRAFT_519059 [Polyplosphaeria fusca]|uniref:Uncharacterized protein n=1 Tax=Polyplosphaeria fusca TaxID=682080 RepID=A0A9P4RAH1_9PLEO|nr:hypothetical protein EJ04DRAFT_519059 [Polyplosphaeria fusca]
MDAERSKNIRGGDDQGDGTWLELDEWVGPPRINRVDHDTSVSGYQNSPFLQHSVAAVDVYGFRLCHKCIMTPESDGLPCPWEFIHFYYYAVFDSSDEQSRKNLKEAARSGRVNDGPAYEQELEKGTIAFLKVPAAMNSCPRCDQRTTKLDGDDCKTTETDESLALIAQNYIQRNSIRQRLERISKDGSNHHFVPSALEWACPKCSVSVRSDRTDQQKKKLEAWRKHVRHYDGKADRLNNVKSRPYKRVKFYTGDNIIERYCIINTFRNGLKCENRRFGEGPIIESSGQPCQYVYSGKVPEFSSTERCLPGETTFVDESFPNPTSQPPPSHSSGPAQISQDPQRESSKSSQAREPQPGNGAAPESTARPSSPRKRISINSLLNASNRGPRLSRYSL